MFYLSIIIIIIIPLNGDYFRNWQLTFEIYKEFLELIVTILKLKNFFVNLIDNITWFILLIYSAKLNDISAMQDEDRTLIIISILLLR